MDERQENDDVANMSIARLNAVSAAEVMQWRRTANRPSEYIVKEGLTTEFLAVDQWRPAENIADAFQVREKMRELGFEIWLSDDANQYPGLSRASFVRKEGTLEEITIAETDALAITRAAVLAVRAAKASQGDKT